VNRNYLVKRLRNTVLAAGGILLLCSAAVAAPITGGNTMVDFSASALATLTSSGFSIAPISPTTLNLTSVPAVAVFPITGGDTTTSIIHSGGLAFTKGGITADLQNFVINLAGPNAGILTGQLVAGGNTTNNVPFFTIGAGNNTLTVTFTLGSTLSSIYGVPNLAGLTIGAATVNPTTSAVPEPRDAVLIAMGLLGVIAFVRRKTDSKAQAN
jgi:hypothetical protein